MKKTLFTLFAVFAMVLIGCSQPTGGDISDWENPPSEIGGGDSTDPEDPVTKFTVTFSTEKGTAPEALTVEKDTVLTAEQLKELTFEGFVFKGWFDGATEAKAGEYKVTKNVELTAKWKESSSTEPDPVEPEDPEPEADPEDPVTAPEPEKSPYEELLKDIENATVWSIKDITGSFYTSDYDSTDLSKESEYEDFTVAIFIEKCFEAIQNRKTEFSVELLEFENVKYFRISNGSSIACIGEKYLASISIPSNTKILADGRVYDESGNSIVNTLKLEIYKKKQLKVKFKKATEK